MGVITTRDDDDSLKNQGIECLKVGHNFQDVESNSCTIQIIIEIKLIKDRKFKKGYYFSFGILNHGGLFVGAGDIVISDRKIYYKEGLLYTFINCSQNSKNINEIKVYIREW